MKKISQKKFKNLESLESRLKKLERDYATLFVNCMDVYEISDEHFDYDYDNWTEDDYEFAEEFAELHAELESKSHIISAKWAADFLVVANIARRGKLLHPDSAKRKLQKYGANGQKVIYMIDKPVVPCVINAEPYLARELYHKYNITLMDKNLADWTESKITELANYANPKYSPRAYKKLQQLKNFSKKFHKSVISKQK